MEMMNRDPDLDFDGADDVYYAELRSQILLLIADEDLHDPTRRPPRNGSMGGFGTTIQPRMYLSWPESERSDLVPPRILSSWNKNGNGTGVFIPHIVKTDRRHRQGRMNKDRGMTYKQKGSK